MKTQAIIAGSILTVVNGAVFVPALAVYAAYAPMASVAIGLWLLARAAIVKTAVPAVVEAAAPVASAPPVEPKIPAAAVPENAGEAEVITLLGAFQEKGRLVDFLMDDINAYSDSQVGAAARVVHQGCAFVLEEHFTVAPVSDAGEGSRVVVPADAPDGYYRLSGKVQGSAPFSGKLVHKGWKTERVRLPRVLAKPSAGLPAIAPAQVEVS